MTRPSRRRIALALALALSVLAGAAGASALGLDGSLAPQSTDAAWISEETGTLTATAGTVSPAVTTCEGRNSAPNLLHLSAPEDGLEVTGYLVTIDLDEGSAPDEWQSGQTDEGYPFVPAATPTLVPASTSTVAWGVASGWNHTWTGTVSVRAVGPGGWTSPAVSHTWSIGYDLLGLGYGSCDE